MFSKANKKTEDASCNAKKAHNLPITSMVVASLVGVGVMSLVSCFSCHKQKDSKY